MEAVHTQLLLHVEVRWLSRGQVLSRFCELREERITCFISEESKLADLLNDEIWCDKVAFLADISQTLNTLNKSMQGKTENFLTCTDKINSFKEKVTLCGARMKKEKKIEIFELTRSYRLKKLCRFNSTKFVTLSFQWLFQPIQGPGLLFSSVIIFTDRRTPWTSDQPVARPLPKHRTTQTQNKRIHTKHIHALSGIQNFSSWSRLLY
jgi:hypothetical protein